MTSKRPCSSCREPTTGVSKVDPDRPLCSRCQPRPLKTPTLATLAHRPAAPRPHQCRICLAPETQSQVGLWMVSSLKNGTCKDRLACESRQPPLISEGEL